MAAMENDNEYTSRAKTYLQAVIRAENRFRTRSLYRKRLQDMAKDVSAGAVGAVGDGYLFVPQDLRGRLADLDRELKEDLAHLQTLREQTWDLLSQLSHPKAQQLLEDFYFHDTPIHVIAAQTNYSERYVYRLKAQALRELGKLLLDHAIEDTQYDGHESFGVSCVNACRKEKKPSPISNHR
ncbi:MAG: hypothetical protein IKE24_01440 [Clostridia bacterium]|nr:hypothetical protein [Clostridia bacterium]